jgi:hypothetical protein
MLVKRKRMLSVSDLLTLKNDKEYFVSEAEPWHRSKVRLNSWKREKDEKSILK